MWPPPTLCPKNSHDSAPIVHLSGHNISHASSTTRARKRAGQCNRVGVRVYI